MCKLYKDLLCPRGVQWSSCSRKQIQHFLSSPTASCLLNPPLAQEFPLASARLPGEVMSPDMQCFKDVVCTKDKLQYRKVTRVLKVMSPDIRTCSASRMWYVPKINYNIEK